MITCFKIRNPAPPVLLYQCWKDKGYVTARSVINEVTDHYLACDQIADTE